MEGQIPENTVLSHDLLEGCFLRCGLASDIMLMDGYPTSYNSFKTITFSYNDFGKFSIMIEHIYSQEEITAINFIVDNKIKNYIKLLKFLTKC